MSSSKLALSFRIFQHGQLVREDTLTQGVIKIGKVPSAHLRIDDESVSRMHAIVEITGSEVSLIDLGSTRGTFVNGKKINKATLQSGDSITLGETRVELVIREAVAVASPPALPALPDAARRVPPPLPVAAVGAVAAVPSVVVAPELAIPPAARAASAASPPSPALFAREQVEDRGSVRAVEVAAMLGDSVIGVKHCMDPRGGKVTAGTWAFVAGGAACLLASAIAFTTSIHTAAVNEEALAKWTHVAHKPAYAFRPTRLGPSTDWAAFGGLALGLIGLSLGVLRIRRERTDPFYRIGTAPGVQLAIEHAPSAAFPLVAPSGDDFVFNYGAGIDGELIVDGTTTPLGELASSGRSRPSPSTAGAIEVPIPANGRIRARAGQTTFVVSAVARPRRHVSPLFASLESRALSYFGGSLAVHLGILALLQMLPPDATTVAVDLPTTEPPLVRVGGTTNDDPPPDKPVEGGDGAVGDREASMAMPQPSGASGKPDAERIASLQVARVANVDPQRSREEAIHEAVVSGALGSALLMTGVKSLAATSDIASGFDLESTNGGIYGAAGEGRGQFGDGLTGWNVGGGCLLEPCGRVPGDGRYDKLLTGTRKGSKYGIPGGHTFGMPGHRVELPHPPDVRVTAGADYSKSIIRRYIMRYKEQLGYCYEKQLLAHPALAGQVTATFFIGTGGTVQSSTAQGLDGEVASCIASVIGTIAFPPPRDGGVQVNYPFTFRPTAR